jgi:hypothetical protein
MYILSGVRFNPAVVASPVESSYDCPVRSHSPYSLFFQRDSMVLRRCAIPVVVLLALLSSAPCSAGSADAHGRTAIFRTPDSLVAALYTAVTFAPGASPDWEYVRSMFDTSALVVLRVTRDSTAIMSVDGFVKDFVDFIARARADRSGFSERVVRMKPLVFGNVASILVLYEASIPGSSRGPQNGVDSFHLVKHAGQWRIVSIVNDVVTKERPVPKELEQ